jgi:spermidine synthase
LPPSLRADGGGVGGPAALSYGPGAKALTQSPLVYLTVLVIATCGLVYELVAGTLASYVLGDSVTQFSTVIGVYLSALGLGSYLSRYVKRGLARGSWRPSWR